MSDPVVKGAKRNTSRPAPQSASTKSSAKGGKVTATTAKPKAQRAAPEKAPVRKAAPAKTTGAAAKPTSKSATKKTPPAPAKKDAAKSKAAPAKSAPAAKAGQAHKAAQQPAKAAAKPQPAKATAAKPQPSKAAPAKAQAHPKHPAQAASQAAKQSKPAAQTTPAKTPAKSAARPAPQPRQPSRDEAAALKAFEKAHKEFARGNFESARDLFRSLIVQHAGVSEVAARARTYLNIAETRLRSEAALPRDADALYDRGVFEMNRGDFVTAQEMFERALKRDPSAADTYYALAATRARLGAVEMAIKALEQAVNLSPKLRLRAQTDIDFIGLRNEPEFERIVFAGPRG